MSQENTAAISQSRSQYIEKWDGAFRSRCLELPKDVLNLSEFELMSHFTVSSIDYLLRKNFWQKTKAAIELGHDSLNTVEIWDGVCSSAYFYSKVLTSQHRLAWILIPVTDSKEMFEEAFHFGLKRLRDEILTMPITEKTAPVIMKAIQFVTDRHLGPMLQKMDINQKTLQMNVDATATMKDAMSSDKLQEKFDALQSRMKDVKQIEAKVDEENNDQG